MEQIFFTIADFNHLYNCIYFNTVQKRQSKKKIGHDLSVLYGSYGHD